MSGSDIVSRNTGELLILPASTGLSFLALLLLRVLSPPALLYDIIKHPTESVQMSLQGRARPLNMTHVMTQHGTNMPETPPGKQMAVWIVVRRGLDSYVPGDLDGTSFSGKEARCEQDSHGLCM